VSAASIIVINPLRNEAMEDSQEASYIARMSFKFLYELANILGQGVFARVSMC